MKIKQLQWKEVSNGVYHAYLDDPIVFNSAMLIMIKPVYWVGDDNEVESGYLLSRICGTTETVMRYGIKSLDNAKSLAQRYFEYFVLELIEP